MHPSIAMALAVDWDAKLAECLAPLAGEGFPIATWNVDAVIRAFILARQFIKAVNLLTREPDESVFRRLIRRGRDWWENPAACTPIQMYEFCIWLRSPDGAAYTDEQRRLLRLEKKALAGQTVVDVCYATAMEAQLNDLYVAMKADVIRSGNESMRKRKFAPAAAYVRPGESEVGDECYKLYKAERARRGEDAEELSPRLLEKVRDAYRGEVVARHKADFMRDEGRREEVRVWLEEKVAELEIIGKIKQEKTYRFYLKTMGGDGVAVAAGSRRSLRRGMTEEEEDIVPAARRQRVEKAQTVEQGGDDPI